jgi:PIN domain nuclease of toxin-antitoxin system
MKILLDTQAFLWIISDAPELSKKAKKIFLDQENDLFLSLASIWEMAIKLSLGKLKLKQPIEKFFPAQLQENSILQLDISFRHVVGVTSLPFHHRDPFDRLIISQAIQENLPILSCDEVFDAYNIQRLW